VKRTKPKCHYVGIKISSIKLKYGCSFRRFGKYGRRKFCCDTKRHCNGVKCYNKRKCKFVGTIFTRRQNIKCRFVQKKPYSKQNFCCTFERSCRINKKVKSCKKRKIGCGFYGIEIRTRRTRKCHIRKSGRYTTRKRCCSWNSGLKKEKQ